MMNMYALISTVLCLLAVLSGCEKIHQESRQTTPSKIAVPAQPNPGTKAKEKYSCANLMEELVFSSNLDVLKRFNDMAARTENISAEKITIEIYSRETSDRTGELRTVENTVAWLEFIPENQKLNDVTADPESPVPLTYDKTILSRHPLSDTCGLKNATSVRTSSIP